MAEKVENSKEKCAYPNCPNNAEYVYSNRMPKGYVNQRIAVCKKHSDLLLFIEEVSSKF